MRELRLKYIINLVSDIGAKAKTDQQALTMAQKAVQDAFKNTELHIGAVERALLMMGRVGSKSATEQANYLAKLALRYHDLRKAAEGASQAMQTAARLGASATAGAYAIDRMTRAPMEYNLRLAHMANTAYSDRSASGRLAGKATLNAAITSSVRVGGGKREDAAEALDELIASGAMSPEDAIKLLPMITKGSTASGAPAKQLATIALRGIQSFGIKLDQVPELINMGMVAGQAGGFELKDMAKWTAPAMAAGSISGMKGMEDLRRIFAGMQASVITAGSKDAAGNNMVNLLAKINSHDTAQDFKKLGYDLPAELARFRGKGINSLDAFVGFVDEIASQDKAFVALKAKMAKGGNSMEKQETAEAMANILQGKAIGSVVQDREALMALIANMNNRAYVKEVQDKTRRNTGELGTSFSVIGQEAEFARQQAMNEAAIGAERTFQKLEPAIRGVLDTSTLLAREFPGLTTGVVLATGALAVFTTALGASGLIGILTGKAGNAGGVVGTVGTLASGAVAGAAGSVASLWRPGGKSLRAAGAVLGPILAGLMDAWDVSNDGSLSADGKRRGYFGAGAGTLGGWGGATAGAALGTMLFPGVGTLVGGALGGFGGYVGGKGALNWLWDQDPAGGAAALSPKIDLGQGRIEINVKVQDDRVQASTTFADMANISLIGGNTNPAGY